MMIEYNGIKYNIDDNVIEQFEKISNCNFKPSVIGMAVDEDSTYREHYNISTSILRFAEKLQKEGELAAKITRDGIRHTNKKLTMDELNRVIKE